MRIASKIPQPNHCNPKTSLENKIPQLVRAHYTTAFSSAEVPKFWDEGGIIGISPKASFENKIPQQVRAHYTTAFSSAEVPKFWDEGGLNFLAKSTMRAVRFSLSLKLSTSL